MGWAFLSVDHVSNPTLGVHPLARSRCQGLVLGIVNPNATNSGLFGTIPISDVPRRHFVFRYRERHPGVEGGLRGFERLVRTEEEATARNLRVQTECGCPAQHYPVLETRCVGLPGEPSAVG